MAGSSFNLNFDIDWYSPPGIASHYDYYDARTAYTNTTTAGTTIVMKPVAYTIDNISCGHMYQLQTGLDNSEGDHKVLTNLLSALKNADLSKLSLDELVLAQSWLYDLFHGFLDNNLPVPDWAQDRVAAIRDMITYKSKLALREEQERLTKEAKELMSRSDRLAEVNKRLEEVKEKLGD